MLRTGCCNGSKLVVVRCAALSGKAMPSSPSMACSLQDIWRRMRSGSRLSNRSEREVVSPMACQPGKFPQS